ncbi:MAG: glycosyl hydrolase [Candidatus Merdivicinus sp.]
MDRKISECLEDKVPGKYILSFFWQHGEEHKVLLQEIDAMLNCGIREFCVESRVHEQFGEEKWWEDFGFILQEAKKRDMRVWLLDDRRFPTGHANGYIEMHPELRAVSLRVSYLDYAGPQTEMALIPEPLEEGESYVAVVAYRRKERGNRLSGEEIQLLKNLDQGLLWWDIPEGIWRIYYVVRTHAVCNSRRENYIDMMSPASCKAMLHAVYDPHYEHFGEYFGNTFAGFFSDEPSFGNDMYTYYSMLGKEDMLIPWSDDMLKLLAEKTGETEERIRLLLPALWHEIEAETPIVRESYMEVVTEKYRRNFCCMLGDWCRAHHVMYIGHIVEDMNAHQRLGNGAGHFFRALDGQDMAGIDVVLHQITPGQLSLEHTAPLMGKRADPDFFHYTLAKLASSHAHIQPLKKNRAMCEIFGAFGWAEGIPMMKYLADHMLVCGIIYFVPHAFSPKYPDYDCPPHFYACGTNSQYPLFGDLMRYMARTAHVLSEGVHCADVAVYYNAEAEWSGGKNMSQQAVCRVLTRSQIDFDLIPQDTLVHSVCSEGKLLVNEEAYGALIVPYSQYLPERAIDAMVRLVKEGLPVIFVDGLPESTSEQRPVGEKLRKAEAVPLNRLPEELNARGLQSIEMQHPSETVRFYHVEREGNHLFFFWNEDLWKEIDTFVMLPVKGRAVFYDGWNNQAFQAEQKGNAVRLRLAPCAAILVCVERDWQREVLPEYDYNDRQWEEVSFDWNISLQGALEKAFTPYCRGGLRNLAKELPRFAGVIRYEAVLPLSQENPADVMMDLGRVGETAQLWVNGVCCGARVSAPFRFCLDGKLVKGENRIRIEVRNNLAYRERDHLSQYLPLPPTGLLGPVKLSGVK